ncbi:MAG: PEP-CTERM system histidine kinase PrsK, partial [Gammaproteobacteria bacterium]|nr:PEP-CTERM system histidine kinase PrsK [Gammaproteobacteria bacterium]
NEVLMGFIILAEARVLRQINWEDRDLLKTAGYQVANQIALLKATRELMDARQFEAFNRLASFIVHDLKNLSAQLSLIISNSDRHKHNPAFVDDMISTVENVTNKMNRMLSQLRKGIVGEENKVSVNLEQVLTEVISLCSGKRPVPELKIEDKELCLYIEQERLINVISHLVQNAQEATHDDGVVEIYAYQKQESAIVEILDNGSGMTDEFVNDRLFRPFDTTKGNAGMGIGVYESREFVWSQGGDISVNSQKGMGTVFRITLPIYNKDMKSGQDAESNTMTGVCN